MKYSIGIVTYSKRFHAFFEPLVNSIKESKPDVDIIVAVNGDCSKEFDESYRKKMLSFCSEHSKIFPMFFTEHRSLAKMWNNTVLNCPTENLLLLNDDVYLTEDFWPILEKSIKMQKKEKIKSFKINGSWSHVYLDRREVFENHWFDERLLGVGSEDGDYEWRALKNKGLDQFPDHLIMKGIINRTKQTADSTLAQKKARLINHKYFHINKEVMHQIKYKPSPDSPQRGILSLSKYGPHVEEKEPCEQQYPYEEFYWDNKQNI